MQILFLSFQLEVTNISLLGEQSVFIDFNKTVDTASILLFVDAAAEESSPTTLEILFYEGVSSDEIGENMTEWLVSSTTANIR